MKDLFLNVDLAIGTYRYAVRRTIPEMTRIAWRDKREEIEQRTPGVTESALVYRRCPYRGTIVGGLCAGCVIVCYLQTGCMSREAPPPERQQSSGHRLRAGQESDLGCQKPRAEEPSETSHRIAKRRDWYRIPDSQ